MFFTLQHGTKKRPETFVIATNLTLRLLIARESIGRRYRSFGRYRQIDITRLDKI